jgi:cobalamin biosynthesis Mg chelatase CobN
MNDLLLLKKQPAKEHTIVNQLQSELESAHSMSRARTTVNHHKRPSISCEISSKRIKGQESLKTTPQLLQQLITTTGMSSPKSGRQKVQHNHSVEESQRWKPQQQQQQQQQPASNSVLMNLLVSGCDVSAGYYTCLPRPKVAKA